MTKRVYYTGGLNKVWTEEDEKKKLGVAGTLRPTKIIVGGQTVLLPAPGEYLDVEDWVAKELMSRYKHPNAIIFTDKPRLAKQIVGNKARIENGVLIEREEVKQLSEDEILEMAERIRMKRESDANADVLDDDEEEKPKAKKVSKVKKVASSDSDLASLEDELALIGTGE